MRHKLAITVEFLRRIHVARSDHLFPFLRPARVRDEWVHIGGEIVFVGDEGVPESRRTAVCELDFHD